MNDLQEAILKIQMELKAPKKQYNNFAKFHYRNAEDILEALKPLLKKYEVFQKVTDEVVNIGNANYVKATVVVSKGDLTDTASGFAREEESLKGQIAAQITGGASSYAKKYALDGMYNIDDSEDPDSQDNTQTGSKSVAKDTVQQKAYSNPESPATDAQKQLVANMLAKNGIPIEDMPSHLTEQYGVMNPKEMTKEQAGMVIESLKGVI